ncbi:T9SS type A sorting domain-containing protein [Reichenbachiella ulvae]|uniref:T9SS type A sorting domain-containing protein n=1 Tax=Reichenbachiella ulvae TaxID=2980104 RepID=A0ABT3CN16_9BACT|nr:T9SS type A sorting domain-containing protein [Reichenbachiella ulvae]MCV9385026.1 T9SS type A sorting domain-containing protein [Reichenbachiella ulvae]
MRKTTLFNLFLILAVFSVNAQNPGGIGDTELVLWLKADAGTSTTIDGTELDTWTDQSPTGTSATNNGTPEYRNNTTDNLNFNPVVDFINPDGDYFTTTATSLLGAGNAYTKIVVTIIDNTTINNNLISSGASGNHALFINNASGDAPTLFHGSPILSGSSITSGSPYIISGRFRGNTGGTLDNILNLNGNQIASNTSTTSFTDGGAIQIGAFQNGNNMDGRIAEVVVYNNEISDSELAQVETYLAIKYGISLTRDYIASDGTTIWITGGGFDNDITGIGYDVSSSLDQQKSKSMNSDGIITLDKGGAFSSDEQFVIIGNDDGSLLATQSGIPSTVNFRCGRTWYFSELGTGGDAGSISITFDIASLGLGGAVASDFKLLADTDTDFTTGATETAADILSNNTITFSAVDLDHGTYFTLATTGEAPGGLGSDLRMWFKADAGVSPSTDGATITSWAGQSNLSATATPSGDPAYVDNSTDNINYNPSVDFDGTGDFFTTDQIGTIGTSSDYTKLVVAVLHNTTGANNLVSADDVGSSHAIYFNGSSTPTIYQGNTNFYSGGTVTANEPVLIAVRYGFNGSLNNIININGLQSVTSPSSSQQPFSDNGGINLGTFNSQNANVLNGYISEAIIYNESLSDAEIKQIESYLAIKYGIALDQSSPTDYVNSNGTVIWDATTNSGYDNGLIGIARDDASGLNQGKSTLQVGNNSFTVARGDITTPETFAQNQSSIILGHNGQALTESATEIPTSGIVTSRLGIEFKLDITNFSETLDLLIDLDNATGVTFNNQMELMIDEDGDGDFTTGFVRRIGASSSDNTEKTVYFDNITINDGEVITLGTQIAAHGPGGISSNLAVWFKANEGVIGSSPVTTWSDQSSNEDDAASTGTGPSYTENAINSNPALRYSGTEDLFTTTVDDGTNSSFDIFAVASASAFSATSENNGIIQGSATSFSSSQNIGMWITENGELSGRVIQNDATIVDYPTTTILTTNTPYLLNNFADGAGTSGQLINGLSASVAQVYNNTVGDWSAFGIGRQENDEWQGDIAEVIAYNQKLSTNDQRQVESYLALKYGLTIDQSSPSDYYDSQTTTIWDATTFSTYSNDIAGIGRDDFSDLDQRSSRSANSDSRVIIEKSSGFSTDRVFYIWGNDNDVMESKDETDFPGGEGLEGRVARTWHIEIQNDNGNVDVTFDLSGLLPVNTSDLRLLIDQDQDGLFNDETVAGSGIISGATNPSAGLYQFSGVNLDDGDNFTIATIDMTNSPLPVVFSDFSLELINQTVVIDWITSSEIENNYFEIERSSDQRNWISIQRVNGAGNSNQELRYSIQDLHPNQGTNYYRIKQTDFDGSFSFSDTKSIYLTPFIELFPNPAKNNINVAIRSSNYVNIVFQDLAGKQIKLPVSQNNNQYSLNTQHLPSGLYLITISTETYQVQRKIVINK